MASLSTPPSTHHPLTDVATAVLLQMREMCGQRLRQAQEEDTHIDHAPHSLEFSTSPSLLGMR